MPAVFLSYARADAFDQAVALSDALVRLGVQVFLDDRDLRHGPDLVSQLSDLIDRTDALITLATPGWTSSRWCQHELGVAVSSGIPIVPVVLGGVTQLPPSLRPYLAVTWQGAIDTARDLYQALATSAGAGPATRIRQQCGATLGGITQYQPAVTVPRSQVEEVLAEHLDRHKRSVAQRRTVVAVLGPQGVGKTTAVCHFLEATDRLAVVGLARRPAGLKPEGPWRMGNVELPRDVVPRDAQDGPLVVVLDGLNEGDPESVLRVLRGEGLDRILHAGAVLIVTCWPAHWRRRFRAAFSSAEEIEVPEFTGEERDAALARRGLSPQDLSPTLLELCKRPALLDHVHRLRDKLGDLSQVGELDIYVADLLYKAGQRWLQPGDVVGFRDHLVDLVRAWWEHGPIELASELLGPRWSQPERKMMVLQDLGFVQADLAAGVLHVVHPEATQAAMALHLRKVAALGATRTERVEGLKRELEHIGERPMMLTAARMAVGLALADGAAEAAEALVIWLADARNADLDDLVDYGRRVMPFLELLARDLVDESLLEHPTVARSRAESTLVWILDHQHDGAWLLQLAQSNRAVDLSLAQSAMERLAAPDLMVPLLERMVELDQLFGDDDGRVITVLLGLEAAYADALTPHLLLRLDEGPNTVHRLVSNLGHPSFLEPILDRAEAADLPAVWLDRLPYWPDPAANVRLERFLADAQAPAARTVFDWRAWTGSPGIAAATRAMGPSGLVERELRVAAWGARRLGEAEEIVQWLDSLDAAALSEEPVEVRDAIREACLLFGAFDGVLRWGELVEDDLGHALAVPLPPGQRAAHIARFAAATSDQALDLHGLALVAPAQAADGIEQLGEPSVAVEYATGLLLPPDSVRSLVSEPLPELGFSLRLACYVEDPSVRARAVEQLGTGESVGLDCLCALSDPMAALGPPGRDQLRDARLFAWAYQGGHPRPPSVEQTIRQALTTCPPDDPLLSALSGLPHDGWPELRRLARLEDSNSALLWLLAGQGPVDPTLYEILLAQHLDPDGEHLFRNAPVHPMFAQPVQAHLDRAVERGVPDDEAEKLLFCECLQAAVTQGLELPKAFLRHLALESDAFDVDIAKALLQATVRQAPELTALTLDRMDWPRSSGFLRYVLVRPWLDAPVGSRAPLLAALCHNEEPTQSFPRPGIFEEDVIFGVFALAPPTQREWAEAAGQVERQWRTVLPQLALYLDDPERALDAMDTEPLEAVRRSARSAWVRLAELREVAALVEELERDPDGSLDDRTALHLAWRIDAHQAPQLKRLLARPEGRVRRAAWWVMEATNYAPDVERWP